MLCQEVVNIVILPDQMHGAGVWLPRSVPRVGSAGGEASFCHLAGSRRSAVDAVGRRPHRWSERKQRGSLVGRVNWLRWSTE